jgi:hypothetical protein
MGEGSVMDVESRLLRSQVAVYVDFSRLHLLLCPVLRHRLRQWSSWSYQETIALAQHEEADTYTCGRSISRV